MNTRPECPHVFDSPEAEPWASIAALGRARKIGRRAPRITWAGIVTLVILGACLGVLLASWAVVGGGVR